MSKRYDLLPSYYYEDNTDGVLLESVGKPLRDYKIYGESAQGGNPTPDTPVEIESCGNEVTNIVDINYILENNPSSTTSLERITFQDRDCIRYNMGSKASALRIMQGKFKENTAYTIRAKVASSHSDRGAGGINIVYTDGTYQVVRFQEYAKDNVTNSFRDIIAFTCNYKTIDYIQSGWAAGQWCYIDIENFIITEGVYKHPYTNENQYLLSINSNTKNLANINDVYNFACNINGTQMFTNNTVGTYICTDINGREILVNYCASGYGEDNYDENVKVFKGIFKENTQYTISFECYSAKASINLGFQYTDGNYNTFTIPDYTDTTTVYKCSFTSAVNKTIESVRLFYANGTSYIYLDTIQLEEGTSKSKYVPNGHYDIYLDEPLRKIGDYADYIDYRKQKLFRNVEVVDGTGTLTLEESLRGLAEPIEGPLALPTIATSENTCNVSIDTTVQPSQTVYQYYREGNIK